MSSDVDLVFHVTKDREVGNLDTRWREPTFDPRPLLIREILQKGCRSELGYNVICKGIFNNLRRLLFVDYESSHYDEVVIACMQHYAL